MKNKATYVKYVVVTLFLTNLFLSVLGQNKQISLSPDGKYVYDVSYDRTGKSYKQFLVVQAIIGNWRREIEEAHVDPSHPFVQNGRGLLYKKDDRLVILDLGGTKDLEIKDVVDYALAKNNDSFIFYRCKQQPREGILLNISTGEKKKFQNVDLALFNERGSFLAIKSDFDANHKQLRIYDIVKDSTSLFWSGQASSISNFTFSGDSKNLGFLIKTDDRDSFSIWTYLISGKKARKLVHNGLPNLDSAYEVSNKGFAFTPDGKSLIFYLREKKIKPKQKYASVDIYSYHDPMLQKPLIFGERFFACAISTEENMPDVVQLESPGEILSGTHIGIIDQNIAQAFEHHAISNQFGLVIKFGSDIFPNRSFGYRLVSFSWNKSTLAKFILVNLKTGERTIVLDNVKMSSFSYPLSWFAPNGNTMVYFHPVSKNYFSYEIKTRKNRDLTGKARTEWISGKSNSNTMGRDFFAPYRESNNTFIEEDKLLIQDSYSDLWQVNLTTGNLICMTNHYGRENKVTFMVDHHDRTYGHDETIFLHGRDHESMYNGLYIMSVGKVQNPKRIVYEACNLSPISYYKDQTSNQAIAVYKKESAILTPTTYFRIQGGEEKPVVSVLKSEQKPLQKHIVNWKTPDGKPAFGVLYFPSGFSPKKSYPVIFQIYETVFPNPYEFEIERPVDSLPSSFAADVDVNYYTKKGYFVFRPELNFSPYRPGQVGEFLLNTVESAVHFLTQRAYIDPKRIGLIGHSFGGYETNFIVTHSKLFAAACSGAGVTNLISLAGSYDVSSNGFLSESGDENTQTRIGVLMWDRPDLFIKNSPIFYADRVVTPLLMMANKGDKAVPFNQGFELFKALRRLGKRSWLLQYDNGEHSLDEKIDQEDWNTRQFQFFEHYLMGKKAPVWMTQGIPYDQKGLITGFEYDNSVKTPGDGLPMKNNSAIPLPVRKLMNNKKSITTNGSIK